MAAFAPTACSSYQLEVPATQVDLYNGRKMVVVVIVNIPAVWLSCLQCFDAVDWAAGRASGL